MGNQKLFCDASTVYLSIVFSMEDTACSLRVKPRPSNCAVTIAAAPGAPPPVLFLSVTAYAQPAKVQVCVCCQASSSHWPSQRH